MHAIDFILLALVGLLAAWALSSLRRRQGKNSGCSCGGCGGCGQREACGSQQARVCKSQDARHTP